MFSTATFVLLILLLTNKQAYVNCSLPDLHSVSGAYPFRKQSLVGKVIPCAGEEFNFSIGSVACQKGIMGFFDGMVLAARARINKKK